MTIANLLAFAALMGVLVALIATSKGKNGGAWFLYGFLLWPIALVHILVAEASPKVTEARALAVGEIRKCPRCAELVKREAVACRFCGGSLAAS